MTKEELIQYCDLKIEIQKLEERINKLQKQSDFVADVVQNGYKGHVLIRGIDYSRKHKLDKLEAVLQERYDKALQMQTDIETYINTIPESNIRQIFEHRYIDNMNWIQIMHVMKYDHEDKARKIHDRFLEKN